LCFSISVIIETLSFSVGNKIHRQSLRKRTQLRTAHIERKDQMKDYTEYIQFSSFLSDFFIEKRDKNPAFSVRALAKLLGYQNSSLINDVLRKKRKPTIEIAIKLCRKYYFPKHQTDYLLKICEYERASSFEQRDRLMMEIRKLMAHRTWKVFDLNKYDFMSQPEVLLLYSLIALKDFKPTTAFLNKRLHFKFSQSQLMSALELLVKLEYIQLNAKGRYQYTHKDAVIAAGDAAVASEVNKKFHLSMMNLVQNIFVKLNTPERDVRTTTMGIRKVDFPLIVDAIKLSHSKIMDFASDQNCDDVYILSTQLIPVTTSSKD
jgi:uncharacterized protein (TIGR02147 family)